MALRHPEGQMPIWVVPAMLLVTGLVPLPLARRTECLSLENGTPTPDQLCQASIPAGAWLFAIICWLAALIIWSAQRQERRGRR